MAIDPELYYEYKDEVLARANEQTILKDGEYVAELRPTEQIVEEIPELSETEISEIRTIAEIENVDWEYWHAGDLALEGNLPNPTVEKPDAYDDEL